MSSIRKKKKIFVTVNDKETVTVVTEAIVLLLQYVIVARLQR